MRRSALPLPEDPRMQLSCEVAGADGPNLQVPLWHEIADDHGFLELRANTVASGPLFALHVVFDPDAGGTIAWWESEDGAWMIRAEVGAA